jgi:hypothetical protein
VGHLAKPEAAELLDELHGAARADRSQFLRLLPRLAFGFARGRTFAQTITPEALKNAFIAVPREEGWFLHLTARAIGATGVVEFGTSFGISTIYLGAAVVDNGGGWVVGSELLPSKHQRAVANLKRAGLEQVVDVRLGDALETLRETPGPIDLVFLDGWKDLYLPVLKLLEPRLRLRRARGQHLHVQEGPTPVRGVRAVGRERIRLGDPVDLGRRRVLVLPRPGLLAGVVASPRRADDTQREDRPGSGRRLHGPVRGSVGNPAAAGRRLDEGHDRRGTRDRGRGGLLAGRRSRGPAVRTSLSLEALAGALVPALALSRLR